jgi:hypothetical protein
MCTGLRGACICGHYTALRWASRCDSHCELPQGRVQRVQFQCSACDQCAQEMLNVEIDSEARLCQTERQFVLILTEVERLQMIVEGALWRECYIGSIKLPEKEKRERFVEEEFARVRAQLAAEQKSIEDGVIGDEEAAVKKIRTKWLQILQPRRVALEHRQASHFS